MLHIIIGPRTIRLEVRRAGPGTDPEVGSTTVLRLDIEPGSMLRLTDDGQWVTERAGDPNHDNGLTHPADGGEPGRADQSPSVAQTGELPVEPRRQPDRPAEA